MLERIPYVITLATLLVGSALAAQAEGGAPGASPRAAMREFLTACRAGDHEQAARYLDLRQLPPGRRAKEGPALARRFKAVLDRTLWVELEALSEAPEGDLEDGLARGRERVGVIARAEGPPVEVLLERRSPSPGEPAWRISSATLAAVPALGEEFGLDWVEERLPARWVDTRFLELALWQWVGLPALLLLAVALAWFTTLVFSLVLGALARRTQRAWDDRLVETSVGPARLLLGVLGFAAGLRFLALAVPAERAIQVVASALAVSGAAWLLMRALDVGAEAVRERLIQQGRPGAVGLVPLGRRIAKAFLAALAVIAVMQNVGVNVTGILAGLGVGGLAVALAAQKTVENLFGGLTLAADQPVRVGDFCRFGDKVGTIEEIGMRSTRVRTLDRTLVTVPNAEFSALALENYTQRDRIWFHALLGLRYETTADQLRHVLVRLRELLRADPRVDPDPARVRFVGFGAHSLDLEIFAYLRTRDINEFLAIREELLLQIMDCVAASGSAFAFPSQTLYAAPDPGLDPDRSRAAIEEARAWRSAQEASERSSRSQSGTSAAASSRVSATKTGREAKGAGAPTSQTPRPSSAP
jgi:MscS family membrane protein